MMRRKRGKREMTGRRMLREIEAPRERGGE